MQTAQFLCRMLILCKAEFKSYFCCVCVVIAVSIGIAEISGAAVYPGDENEATQQVATEYRPPLSLQKKREIARRAFYLLIIPALIGVYCGRREKREGVEWIDEL